MSGEFATRAVGVNARGNNRRLGKGKKSSLDAQAKSKGSTASDVSSGKTGGGASAALGGIRSRMRKYSKSANTMVSHIAYGNFLHQIPAHQAELGDKEIYSRLLWLSQSDNNLLLYGVGNKKKFVRKFVNTCLKGEDVLEIEGISAPASEKSIRSCLNTISHHILSETGHSNLGLDPGALSLVGYVDMVTEKLANHYGTRRSTTELSKRLRDDDLSTSSSNLDFLRVVDSHRGKGNGASSFIVAAPKKLRAAAAQASLRSTSGSHGGGGGGGSINISQANPEWVGRYAHAKAKLYLVVHDIGGTSLSSSECQFCLSRLAACPAVCIIATMEHLNTPLMWGTELLARFKWSLECVSTFLPHPAGPNFACVVRDADYASSSSDGAAALEYVLTSLSARHHELLSVVCKYIVEMNSNEADLQLSSAAAAAGSKMNGSKGKKSGVNSINGHRDSHLLKSIPFGVLLDRCTKKLIAQKPDDVKALLKEFIDHKIIALYDGQPQRGAAAGGGGAVGGGGGENVLLRIPFERIQSLADTLH